MLLHEQTRIAADAIGDAQILNNEEDAAHRRTDHRSAEGVTVNEVGRGSSQADHAGIEVLDDFGEPLERRAMCGTRFGPIFIPRNLTPDKTGDPKASASFEEFSSILRTGVDPNPCASAVWTVKA
jgi:hypothetical protein